MKKIIAIVATVLVAGSLAFSLTSCKNDKKDAAKGEKADETVVEANPAEEQAPVLEGLSVESQAVVLMDQLLLAAKKNDIDTFKKIFQDMMTFSEGLTDEENEQIDQLMEGKVSEEDQQMLENFMMEHLADLAELDL